MGADVNRQQSGSDRTNPEGFSEQSEAVEELERC